MIIPVILSGGSGTRLWPLSREGYPKQFIPLIEGSDESMLQQTLSRLDVEGLAAPIIVANQNHRFRIAEQLNELGLKDSKILLEPLGRNTAPAAIMSALVACEQYNNPDALLLILPSDHHIQNAKALNASVAQAAKLAATGKHVLFGITPTYPATGFGYIESGAPVYEGESVDAQLPEAFHIQAFKEKPDEATAQTFLEAGHYFWNSGMFMMSARTLLEEASMFCPEVLEASRLAFASANEDLDFIRLDKETFANIPSISIDYAIMERTQKAVVIPLDAQWSDVGNWSSLWEVSNKDGDSNATFGDTVLHNVNNSLVMSQTALVAMCDVDNLLVIQTKDAVLIANRDKAESVKLLVDTLKAQNRNEHLEHVKVYRPWGSYENIVEGPGFKAKRITVKPKEKLSLQMHHHRAEHWIVVTGTAKVTNGEKVFLLSQDESTYIPIGQTHRLENPGMIPLELIEVQSGSYLEEDDIVRFEDVYNRA